MDRLTRKQQNSEMVWFIDHDNNGLNLEPCEMSYSDSGKAIRKLAYYEDLEEQGRLVTLPCKVGDSFFTFARVCLCPEDENGCDMYERCSICPYNWYEVAEWKFKSVINILNSEPNFGKTMFLTREEAEAKVAKINSETRIKR